MYSISTRCFIYCLITFTNTYSTYLYLNWHQKLLCPCGFTKTWNNIQFWRESLKNEDKNRSFFFLPVIAIWGIRKNGVNKIGITKPCSEQNLSLFCWILDTHICYHRGNFGREKWRRRKFWREKSELWEWRIILCCGKRCPLDWAWAWACFEKRRPATQKEVLGWFSKKFHCFPWSFIGNLSRIATKK